MAQLATCQAYTKECPICGRSQYQNNFCNYLKQAAGTRQYDFEARKNRAGGPHVK